MAELPHDPYKKSQFEHKPKGHIFIDGKEVGHTLQCVHCGAHFLSIRGSGKKRGWCMLCNGVTCSRKKCLLDCVPFEKQLEISEGKKHPSLQVHIAKR